MLTKLFIVGALAFTLMGCESFGQAVKTMKELNPVGCHYVRGGGAWSVEVEAAAASAWGEDMDADKMQACVEKLHQMR